VEALTQLVGIIVGYQLYETRAGRRIPHSVWRQLGNVTITCDGPSRMVGYFLNEPDKLILCA
jgi:hypothetical protein